VGTSAEEPRDREVGAARLTVGQALHRTIDYL